MAVDVAHLKKVACEAIENLSGELNELSQELWKNPELGYQEHRAHGVLIECLRKFGFDKVTPNFVTETGFKAEFGHGSPHIAVLCEYDALPGIGHACGHNLIAEAGVAAGVGIKAAMQAAGQNIGKVTVLGTPAEEEQGGKLDMVQAGFFKDVDAAMMVHPCPFNNVRADFAICIRKVRLKYFGHASHAAAYPWQGINALDAAVLCYNNVSVLRQQMKPNWRVHGVIHNGGVKPNIIPDETELEFYVRAPTMNELAELVKKVHFCFESAAQATGCTVEVKWCDRPYANVISNSKLVKLYTNNAMTLGLDMNCPPEDEMPQGGSTDMGNVSYEVPSIHPMYAIEAEAANHTKEFTVASGDSKAQPATLLQGKTMAMTALDVFVQPAILPEMKEELAKSIK